MLPARDNNYRLQQQVPGYSSGSYYTIGMTDGVYQNTDSVAITATAVGTTAFTLVQKYRHR